MGIFLGYIFLGLSLAAPIGPINAAQLDKGIRNGFLHAWLVGVGALLADALYMALIYFGVIHFLNTPFMMSFLWLFGFFVLVYSGVESVLGAGRILADSVRGSESSAKSFLSGFVLSLTNPLSILFWLGIYGSVLAETAVTSGPKQLLAYSIAMILGIFLWDIAMAGVASGFRRWLTPRLLAGVSIVSGLSLIGFGFYFGLEAYKLLFL